jgi:hypothetical protein
VEVFVRSTAVAAALTVILAIVAGMSTPGPARAAEKQVLRGICDPGLLSSWGRSGPDIVREFDERLGADVVRINLAWSTAEPRRGVYSDDYLNRVAAAVRDVRARDMQAIVLVYHTPRWASDRSLWARPVTGDRPNVYHSYYPPSLGALADFRDFARHLSTLMQGQVLGYSCWVEPNLWTYLYPQRTTADSAFAAHRYTKMLAAFSEGVRAGDPAAQVIAGETSPTGENSRLRTSPQRFVRQIQRAGAGQYFDVLAHHPYAGAGNARITPAAMPRDPDHTVWLANLGTLLDVFPDKPCYLTEFGYPTSPNLLFGVSISAARQAAYLKAAFSIAARYDQVKLLLWFPRKDHSSSGTYRDPWGNYSGLRSLRGQRKRAYYAYAGGNHLSMNSHSYIRRGSSLRLRGRLTSDRMGALAGKSLDVLAKRPHRSWVVVTRIRTRSDGSYSVRIRPERGAKWKVRWAGVVTGPSDWIAVRSR